MSAIVSSQQAPLEPVAELSKEDNERVARFRKIAEEAQWLKGDYYHIMQGQEKYKEEVFGMDIFKEKGATGYFFNNVTATYNTTVPTIMIPLESDEQAKAGNKVLRSGFAVFVDKDEKIIPRVSMLVLTLERPGSPA